MSREPAIHPYETLTTPAGDLVAIDTDMVPVLREIWRLGLATAACCQDVGEALTALRDLSGGRPGHYSDGRIAFYRGYAWLKMPPDDALRLARALLDSAFADRLKQRWSPTAWRMDVPVACEDDDVTPATAIHIYFPRDQIDELNETLATLSSIA